LVEQPTVDADRGARSFAFGGVVHQVTDGLAFCSVGRSRRVATSNVTKERAVGLGWARSRVLVIDEDLGRSAATADSRPGFRSLVTE